MTSDFATAAVLALAIGTVAWTATKAKVSTFIRVWLAKKQGKLWDWLFDLSKCPYCTAHWLAFGAVAIWRPFIVSGWPPLQFLVTSFAMVAVASLVILIIRKALL
jgi:hypothetical protein